jgi:hypothetical protein
MTDQTSFPHEHPFWPLSTLEPLPPPSFRLPPARPRRFHLECPPHLLPSTTAGGPPRPESLPRAAAAESDVAVGAETAVGLAREARPG